MYSKFLRCLAAYIAFAIVLILAVTFSTPKAHAEGITYGYSHGQAYIPQPVDAIGDVMRGTSRFLTRHIDRFVGRTGHGYRAFTAYSRRAPSNVATAAARFIGSNPTGWAHNWCAEFANRVLVRQGYAGSGSAMAISFAHYGPHVGPRPGAIAVLRGHVGFVESVLPGGRIVLVSGNGGRRHGHSGRVTARNTYPRSAFVAFVMPHRGFHRGRG